MDRMDSVHCAHPNVFGCPNHGGDARAFLRYLGLRRWIATHGEPLEAAAAQWPCGYYLTPKGHAAATLSELLDGPLS